MTADVASSSPIALDNVIDLADAPLLAGDLARFPVECVLQFIAASRASGTLHIVRRGERAFISCENGAIVGASSARLPRHRKVTALDREEIEEALFARTAEVLTHVLTWPKGQFAFRKSYLPKTEGAIASVSVERVLMFTAFSLGDERRVG